MRRQCAGDTILASPGLAAKFRDAHQELGLMPGCAVHISSRNVKRPSWEKKVSELPVFAKLNGYGIENVLTVALDRHALAGLASPSAL
jgi:hypothetical protein